MILRVREEVNLLHENGPQLTLAREDMEQMGINSITVAEQSGGVLQRAQSFPVSLLAVPMAPSGTGVPALCGSDATSMVVHLGDFVDLRNQSVTFFLPSTLP